MINRTIKIMYMINTETGKVGFDLNEIAKEGQPGWQVDYNEFTKTFTKFTNKGRVSKSEKSSIAIVNEKAEAILQQRLAIEADCDADMARALELVAVVNKAYMDADKNTKWTTIKTKTSHSEWYRYSGELNMPSRYLVQVPASVEQAAKELQAIRRKHQDDKNFDFKATAYLTREERVADHYNGR